MNNINTAINQANRFSRAQQVIKERYTFTKDSDSDVVAVIKPGQTAASYWINMLTEGCDCPDRMKGNKCKHELAWEIIQAEEEAFNAQAAQWEDEEENRCFAMACAAERGIPGNLRY